MLSTWNHGIEANAAGFHALQQGGNAMDMIEGEDVDEDEGVPEYSLFIYFGLLFTLFLAFAVAGSTRRQSAPTTPETRLTNPCEYVELPQDVIMKVYQRGASLGASDCDKSRDD